MSPTAPPPATIERATVLAAVQLLTPDVDTDTVMSIEIGPHWVRLVQRNLGDGRTITEIPIMPAASPAGPPDLDSDTLHRSPDGGVHDSRDEDRCGNCAPSCEVCGRADLATARPPRCARHVAATSGTAPADQPNPGTVAPPGRQADAEGLREAIGYRVFRAVDIGDTSRAAALAVADDILQALAPTPAPPDLPGAAEAVDLDAIEARAERAHQAIVALCQGERWKMSIPAQPDRDHDLVLDDVVTGDVPALVARVRQLEAELAEARHAAIGLSAGLEAARRDGAAAALDAACGWLPKTCPQIVKKALAMFAREVRVGTRTIPTTTEEPS